MCVYVGVCKHTAGSTAAGPIKLDVRRTSNSVCVSVCMCVCVCVCGKIMPPHHMPPPLGYFCVRLRMCQSAPGRCDAACLISFVCVCVRGLWRL